MSGKSLVERFEERIASIMAHVPSNDGKTPPDLEADSLAYDLACAGIWRDTLETDTRKLAEIVVEEVTRYAEAFIPNAAMRRAVLADDELTAQWPMNTKQSRDVAHWTLTVLDQFSDQSRWPKEVSFKQAADMLLRRKGDAVAERLAAIVVSPSYPFIIPDFGQERGVYLPPNIGKLPPKMFGIDKPSWDSVRVDDIEALPDNSMHAEVNRQTRHILRRFDETALPPEQTSEEERTRRNAAIASMAYLNLWYVWSPSAVALLAYIEHKVETDAERLAQAQAKHVRAPSPMIETFLAGRSSEYRIGTTVRVDPTGRTIQVPSTVRPWRVDPPKGVQLQLPLDHELASSNPLAAVRQALGPAFVRVYLADWYLVAEQGNETGIHKVDPKHILHDVLGLKPAHTTSNGKRYDRPHPRNEKMLDDAYWHFEHTLLLAVGNTRFDPPEQLVRRVELTHEPTGRKGMAFVPSAFAMHEFTRHFMQVPLPALRLPANRVELALGLAAVMRQHVRTWVPGGSLAMSLADWARQAGEPVRERVARDGRAYWARLKEQLAEVATKGGFGRMHFGRGDGGTVIATLEPADDIARVYQELVRRIGERKALSAKAKLEAEVRQLAAAKPKPGRPRKVRR